MIFFFIPLAIYVRNKTERHKAVQNQLICLLWLLYFTFVKVYDKLLYVYYDYYSL